jgi:hypothetical protein
MQPQGGIHNPTNTYPTSFVFLSNALLGTYLLKEDPNMHDFIQGWGKITLSCDQIKYVARAARIGY